MINSNYAFRQVFFPSKNSIHRFHRSQWHLNYFSDLNVSISEFLVREQARLDCQSQFQFNINYRRTFIKNESQTIILFLESSLKRFLTS